MSTPRHDWYSFSRAILLARTGALLVLWAFLAVPVAKAGPGPEEATPPEFRHTNDYYLVVDGQEATSAEIYLNERAPSYLVVAREFTQAVLLTPKTQMVATLASAKLTAKEGGVLKVPAAVAPTPQGQFTFSQGVVSFTMEGHSVSLRPRPPLLGSKRGEDLRTYSLEFSRGYEAFRPDAAVIADLRKVTTPVNVRIFFGSWCPHCQRLVPPMLRVEQDLKGSRIKFEYFGLPEVGMAADPEAKRLGVSGVPTGIVYVNGKEAGRLLGDAWREPEASLRSIIKGALGKGGAESSATPSRLHPGNRRNVR